MHSVQPKRVLFGVLLATTIGMQADAHADSLPIPLVYVPHIKFSSDGTKVTRCIYSGTAADCTDGDIRESVPSWGRSIAGSLATKIARASDYNLHYMRFSLYSGDWLSKAPRAHMAVGLRGIGKVDGPNPRVRGNGATIGSYVTGWCGDRAVAIEKFGDPATGDYYIAPGTCSSTNTIQDNKWYTVEVHVSQSADKRTQWVAYWVSDSSGVRVAGPTVFSDARPYFDPEDVTGWFIGHVGTGTGSSFSFDIYDLVVGVANAP